MKTSKKLTACQQAHQAPDAKQIPYEMEEFGNKRIDPYFWKQETSVDIKDYKVGNWFQGYQE